MKVYTKRKFIEAFEYLKANNFFATHKEFAQSVGMSPQFLSQILHDNTSIPQDLLMRFFKTYPINLGFFYRDEENVLVQGTRMPSSPLEKPVTEFSGSQSNGVSRNGQNSYPQQQPNYFQETPQTSPPPPNFREQNFGYVQKPKNGQMPQQQVAQQQMPQQQVPTSQLMQNQYQNGQVQHTNGHVQHINHPNGRMNRQQMDKDLDLRIAKALENATASINELAKVIMELRG